jgi:hypothetical protein
MTNQVVTDITSRDVPLLRKVRVSKGYAPWPFWVARIPLGTRYKAPPHPFTPEDHRSRPAGLEWRDRELLLTPGSSFPAHLGKPRYAERESDAVRKQKREKDAAHRSLPY